MGDSNGRSQSVRQDGQQGTRSFQAPQGATRAREEGQGCEGQQGQVALEPLRTHQGSAASAADPIKLLFESPSQLLLDALDDTVISMDLVFQLVQHSYHVVQCVVLLKINQFFCRGDCTL